MNYLLFLQNIRQALGGVLDGFMLEITKFGEFYYSIMIIALVYWCVSKRTGQLMAFNLSIASWFNEWIKQIIRVDRPWVADSRITPVDEAIPAATGYSRPSGHTTRAVATFGASGMSCLAKNNKLFGTIMGISKDSESEKNSNGLGILSWLMVALVMFSRNYLGVHYFADVILAFAIGIVFIIGTNWLLNWVEGGEKRDLIVWGVMCVILFIPMIWFGCLSGAGTAYGLLTGWVIERRFIKFKTEGSVRQRILRFVPGGLFLMLCVNSGSDVLSHIIPGKYAGFFMNGFIGLFVMAIYPLIFNIWENAEIGENRRKALKRIVCGIVVGVLVIVTVVGGILVARDVRNGGTGLSSVADAPKGTSLTGEVKTIAHRGYSGIAPENTIAAFNKAVDAGADMIELDVQETKDGRIVVFHDDTLERITGAEGKVADYTLEELQAMDAGSWFSSDYAGEKIPTLNETLYSLWASDAQIYLEIKDIGDGNEIEVENAEGMALAMPNIGPSYVEKVVSEVSMMNMMDRVIFASFNYDYLKQVKEIDETIPVLFITTNGDANELLASYPADYYGISFDGIKYNTVSGLHAQNKPVYVWTVDDTAEAANLMGLGVDGIVTNQTEAVGSVTKK